MAKDNVIKRRSSHGKVARPSGATLRRRKSASAVLEPRTRNEDMKDKEPENPLMLKKQNMNVSAGRTIYERASSRRERHRLALKNGIEDGEKDGSNHFVALGRGGARGPNRSSLTKETSEGEDPGLLAIEASKLKKRRKNPSSIKQGGSTKGRTNPNRTSQRNQSVLAAKMKATKQKSIKGSLREKLMKR